MSKTHFAVAAAAFGGASDIFWPCCWQWSFFFWRWGYKMLLLSVHICYWCWRRCWCWDWCGATYSHVNDTASARGWSWSIRTKRYLFLTRYRFTMFYHVLPRFATIQLILQHVSNLSFSSTPANYQQHYLHKMSHWRKGLCLNLLAICSTSTSYQVWIIKSFRSLCCFVADCHQAKVINCQTRLDL